MTPRAVPDHLPQDRFPVDPWRFIECDYEPANVALNETLFAVANGYLGLRGDHVEGRNVRDPGMFVNGFHETWSIHHAEEAFGFATTGQTIVNAPDPKVLTLYVDDEPFDLDRADLQRYERVLDMRRGTVARDICWRTDAGKVIGIRSERLVSLVHRHVAAISYEVTMERGSAPVAITSRIINRQDAEFIDAAKGGGNAAASGPERDPRRHRSFGHRVLQPQLAEGDAHELTLGYRCANSGMSIALAVRHRVDAGADRVVVDSAEIDPDESVATFSVSLAEGESLRITKFVAVHTSRYVRPDSTAIPDDVADLAQRCHRSLDRVESEGFDALVAAQEAWLADFWERSDVVMAPRGAETAARVESDQQAMRWNLFQLAQASAQTGGHGIAAKGVTGGGYEGHYFWDTEMYVIPFLAYTAPEAARRLLRFRWQMLPVARSRARELDQVGALYPWRTINGDEASAYYAAGTAQYHINAAVAFALKRYVEASGDVEFLANEGAEILVETARLWNDLGFFSTRSAACNSSNGGRAGRGGQWFHIHGVTGPDEYTAVVNDNLYTNVMARFNLRWAARVLELLEENAPEAYADVVRRVELDAAEPQQWIDAAEAMYLPYDSQLGIHPQDSDFLQLQPWDFAGTPRSKYPLLLHFHPLVIYRHQVLKQADVVLAMALRNDQFTPEVRRRNFDYYDPITTGDSSLSACVQAMAAAQIGYRDLALRYFREALYVDLADLHHNTRDGVHVASAGGVWGTVVFGFAGLFDTGTALSFDPCLPDEWETVTFHIERHGSRLQVVLDGEGCTVTVLSGDPVPVHTTAGFTGMSPEPTGYDEATMDDAAPAPDGDTVVLVDVGHSLRIAGATPVPALR